MLKTLTLVYISITHESNLILYYSLPYYMYMETPSNIVTPLPGLYLFSLPRGGEWEIYKFIMTYVGTGYDIFFQQWLFILKFIIMQSGNSYPIPLQPLMGCYVIKLIMQGGKSHPILLHTLHGVMWRFPRTSLTLPIKVKSIIWHHSLSCIDWLYLPVCPKQPTSVWSCTKVTQFWLSKSK